MTLIEKRYSKLSSTSRRVFWPAGTQINTDKKGFFTYIIPHKKAGMCY